MPEYPETSGCDVAPDWVCEVLSPSTASVDRVKKLPIYARAGVPWVWIVDPVGQTIEVKTLATDDYRDVVRHGRDEKVRIEPFIEIEIDLSVIWGSTPPL
jgi:Uma2 family endonuclease